MHAAGRAGMQRGVLACSQAVEKGAAAATSSYHASQQMHACMLPPVESCVAGVLPPTDPAGSPLGCHISDVKRHWGGELGYSLGKVMRALKKPPSLQDREQHQHMLFLRGGFEQQQRWCASIQADTHLGSPAHAAALWFGFGHHQMNWLCMQPAAAAQQLANAARSGCRQLSQPRATHYRVSGGPIMVTAHSKMFESSTRPAEKPSTGFLVKSAGQQLDEVWRWPTTMQGGGRSWLAVGVRDHLSTAS